MVLGPESTGTRYTTALLEAARTDELTRIERRSLPYNQRFIPLDEVMGELDRNEVYAVMTSRRADVLGPSQVQHGHAATPAEALRCAERGYVFAITECAKLVVPFLMTSYEAFADPAYRAFICGWALGDYDHETARSYGFEDGNAKYL